jgi:hypothetical protein
MSQMQGTFAGTGTERRRRDVLFEHQEAGSQPQYLFRDLLRDLHHGVPIDAGFSRAT